MLPLKVHSIIYNKDDIGLDENFGEKSNTFPSHVVCYTITEITHIMQYSLENTIVWQSVLPDEPMIPGFKLYFVFIRKSGGFQWLLGLCPRSYISLSISKYRVCDWVHFKILARSPISKPWLMNGEKMSFLFQFIYDELFCVVDIFVRYNQNSEDHTALFSIKKNNWDGACVHNQIHWFLWNVVTHPWQNLNIRRYRWTAIEVKRTLMSNYSPLIIWVSLFSSVF